MKRLISVVVVLAAVSVQAGELPRAWNWCTGENEAGPTPAWQAGRLAAGDPLFPHFEFYAFRKWRDGAEYITPGLAAARERKLPFVFVYQNVFDTWRVRSPWKDRPWSKNPDDHPLQVRASDGKVVDRLTFWSNRIDHSYELGYILATKPFTVEAAKLYPDPPFVVFADNGEIGTVEKRDDMLDDVRVPERIRELQAAVDAADGDTKLALSGYLDSVLDDAMRTGYARHYNAFRNGFRDGLATHAPLWAERFHWVMYGQSGNEYGFSEAKSLDNFVDYRYETPWSGVANDNAYRHEWGPSGQLYVQPWYGGFHILRTVIQADNIRYAYDLREGQGMTMPRFQMVWEGRDTNLKPRPTREQWRGLVRYWLWVTQADYFGHFSESQSVVAEPKIATYYDEVIKACREVHDDERLREFWLNGELEPSTGKNPYEWDKSTHPAVLGRPYYLLEVAEQNRVDDKGDTWIRDRTRRSPVNVLALSVKHRDGRRLVYAAGLEQSYDSVTVTVPVVGQRQFAAPVGGAFYELPATTEPPPVEPPVDPEEPPPAETPPTEPSPPAETPPLEEPPALDPRIAELEEALQIERDKYAALVAQITAIREQLNNLLAQDDMP